MHTKFYQGTIETLLENDAFVSEFLQGVRRADLSRLIDDGIFAKLFIADSARKNLYGGSIAMGEDEFKAA